MVPLLVVLVGRACSIRQRKRNASVGNRRSRLEVKEHLNAQSHSNSLTCYHSFFFLFFFSDILFYSNHFSNLYTRDPVRLFIPSMLHFEYPSGLDLTSV